VRIVGIAGGWFFLVWLVVGVRRESARQRAIAAAAPARHNVVSGGTLGLCPKCKRPKLPPGVAAPSYLSVCDCAPPSPAAAREGRPPRPIT
jgi:hypothetical protein